MNVHICASNRISAEILERGDDSTISSNLTHGTQNYQRCYDDSTPSPTPAPIEVGQCGKHCHHDSDCAVGGFNSCFTCGKYEGTEYYHRCYDSSAVDESSTSVTYKYLSAHK